MVNFDPTLQYVSTTGQHAFVPPVTGDFRGPCPGLNAMANQSVKRQIFLQFHVC